MEFTVPLNSGTNGINNHSFHLWKNLQKHFDEHQKFGQELTSSTETETQPELSLFMYLCEQSILDVFDFVSVEDKKHFISNILRKLEDLCMPKFLLLYHRFRFFARHQEVEESVCDFTAGLEELVIDCEFSSHEDNFMAKQICQGVSDEALHLKLLKEKDLKVKKAIQICQMDSIICQKSKDFSFLTKYRNFDETKRTLEAYRSKRLERLRPMHSEQSRPKYVERHRLACLNRYRLKHLEKQRLVRLQRPQLLRTMPASVGVETSSQVPSKLRSLNGMKSLGPLKKWLNSKRGNKASQKANAGTSERVVENKNLDVQKESESTPEVASHPNDVAFVPNVDELEPVTNDARNLVSSLIQGTDISTADVKTPIFRVSPLSFDDITSPNPVKQETLSDSSESVEENDGDVLQDEGEHSFDGLADAHSKSHVIAPAACSENTKEHTRGNFVTRPSGYSRKFSLPPRSAFSVHQYLMSRKSASTSHQTEVPFKYDVSNKQHQIPPGISEPVQGLKTPSHTCQECGCSFSCENDLKNHECKKKTFSCVGCGYLFEQEAEYRAHYCECSQKAFKCPNCPESFDHESLLRHHKLRHLMEKSYICDQCGKEVGTREGLNRHRMKHFDTGINCKICGRSFPYISTLRIHERTHTGNRPFCCEICGSTHSTNGDLTRHKKTHTGDKPFQCSECGFRCISASRLKLHERRHTEERPFTCEICGSSYRQAHGLKEHKRMHTGERPYVCKTCGDSFTRKKYLMRHENSHTGIKAFICDICGKAFSRKSNMRAHRKLHV